MGPQLEKLSLLNIAVGLEQCNKEEKEYTENILRYYEQELWGDIQAYFEMRDWEKYLTALEKLEKSSRNIGAEKLAAAVTRLGIAAREKNEYYILRHQASAMELYHDILDQIEAVFIEKKRERKTKQSKEKARILLVDDDSNSIAPAKDILSEGFELFVSRSGAEVFGKLKELQPDILLMDVYMPGIDGFEILRVLQGNEDYKDIPVVLLANGYNKDVEVRAFRAGAQDFIAKPLEKEIVVQRISRILELSKLQKHLQDEVERQTKHAEERSKQVERLSNQIINALAESIDAKDSYTNGHSLRVAQYSVQIARRAGKSKEEQERIHYMGMLHDIGKIGIPDSIITKNSGLSDREYFVTRKHPEIGAEILANISEIPDLGIGARWHHERYDGTGYPDGLKGNEIPEEARIIAVADAYDAMASRRSYRDVLPQQEVYEEIKKGKGTQFDPVFAEIMMALIEEDTAYNLREK